MSVISCYLSALAFMVLMLVYYLSALALIVLIPLAEVFNEFFASIPSTMTRSLSSLPSKAENLLHSSVVDYI